jgi:hypothetical protein
VIRRRTRRDPVTPEFREAVFARDLGCVLAFLQRGHVCRSRWGERVDWQDRSAWSIEHVKSDLRMGVRAASDMAHTVTLCAGANLAVPSKEQRALIRTYLTMRSKASA